MPRPDDAPPSPSPRPLPTAVLCQTHLVQSGDSVWSIAALYGVQQDDLLSVLQECVGYVPGSALAVGQKICLPGWVPACDYVIDSGVRGCGGR